MKKILLSITCSLFAIMTFTLITPTQAKATTMPTTEFQVISEYVERLDDGSYFHVIVSEEPESNDSRSITQTKSGSRKTTYYDPDGIALWAFTIHGTFKYTPGANAACTSSSYTVDIYDDNWENTAAASSINGNQAVGDATFIKEMLFITTHTEHVHLVLTCNIYGQLS